MRPCGSAVRFDVHCAYGRYAGAASAQLCTACFPGCRAPVESLTFYLLDSDARVEEIRENVEFAAAQHAEIPPLYYPHAVILLAGTPDEEAQAYARIVERVRASKLQQLNIDVVDLRAQKPE
jgi:hypothetical protein